MRRPRSLALLAALTACGHRPANEPAPASAAATVVHLPTASASPSPPPAPAPVGGDGSGHGPTGGDLAPLSAGCEALFIEQRDCWAEALEKLPPEERETARRRYDDAAAVLRRELGGKPSSDCDRMADALPDECDMASAGPSVASAPPPPPPPPPPPSASSKPPVKICWPLDKGCKRIGVAECDRAFMSLKSCVASKRVPMPEDTLAQAIDALREAAAQSSTPSARAALVTACGEMEQSFKSICP